LRGVARKFDRRIETAVELRRDLVLLLAERQDLFGEPLRVLRPVGQGVDVGIVPAAAQIVQAPQPLLQHALNFARPRP